MEELTPQLITGLPLGVKEAAQRVDMKPDKFDLAIVTKGYRCWWSRSAPCPCKNNDQTDQPDPTCSLCDGLGELLYFPEPAMAGSTVDAHGNPIEVSADGRSVGIDVLMTGINRNPDIFVKFGAWTAGQVLCSTQPGNELGWRDRLELRDALINWNQLIEADGNLVIQVGPRRNRLRYRVTRMILLRTVSRVYTSPADYVINEHGQVVWTSAAVAPAAGTVLSACFRTHPIYRIVDWPHTIRSTLVSKKVQALTKDAQYRRLPTQCTAKLDFLAEGDE